MTDADTPISHILGQSMRADPPARDYHQNSNVLSKEMGEDEIKKWVKKEVKK